jgi:hypothetical protein
MMTIWALKDDYHTSACLHAIGFNSNFGVSEDSGTCEAINQLHSSIKRHAIFYR